MKDFWKNVGKTAGIGFIAGTTAAIAGGVIRAIANMAERAIVSRQKADENEETNIEAE